jgi:hypothetical protein
MAKKAKSSVNIETDKSNKYDKIVKENMDKSALAVVGVRKVQNHLKNN